MIMMDQSILNLDKKTENTEFMSSFDEQERLDSIFNNSEIDCNEELDTKFLLDMLAER